MKIPRQVAAKFENREQGGQLLADLLKPWAGRSDVLVVAIPGGGLPVAIQVKKALNLPLDVLVVQRVIPSQHDPWQQELSLGAVAYGGGYALNSEVIERSGVLPQQLDAAVARAQTELRRKETLYRGECPFPDITKRTIILVDDAIRTGATLRAAIEALRSMGAARIVAAVPVGVVRACEKLTQLADEFICPVQDQACGKIHSRYIDFRKLSDDEIRGMVKANQYQPCE